MRGRMLILVAVALCASLLPAGAEEHLPPACAGDAPAYDPATHELVELTYYFHSEAQVGDVDGYSGFVTGHPHGQYMDEEPPTGTVPKLDTNGSHTSYPATLPGNPIFTSFWGWVEWDLTIACVSWQFWAAGPPQTWDVRLWWDTEFILGDVTPFVETSAAADAGVSEVTAALRLSEPIRARDMLWAEMVAHDAPAAVLYDAVDYPSSVTVVTIEPRT